MVGCSHRAPPSRRFCTCSVSLIECGPVHTAFQEKVQNGPRAALDGADAQTRDLFSRFQSHFEKVYRETAQDPEEVTEVGAGQGSGSRGGLGVLGGPRAQPRPACLLSRPQVFLTALRAPRPALRYFSSERILPLARLRLADPSGCSYVAAMHRAVFGDEPVEGLEGAQTKAKGGKLGGPELDASPPTPQ